MLSALFSVLKSDGERSELAAFYTQNKKKLYAAAFSKLHNHEAAEDAVQEAFLRVAKYPERFFALNNNKRLAYMLVVLVNTTTDSLGSRIGYEELTEDIADDSPAVEDIALGSISADELKRFIDGMPKAKRDAVTLKLVCGYTNSEIADMLGISKAAAEKRISDAYKFIKKYLNGGDGNA